MATKSNLPVEEIGAQTPRLFNRVRSTIETAFYRNNVVKVTSLKQAYELAYNAPGTIVTSQKVLHAEELGLPKDAHVLLFNDGGITGRQAALRRLLNDSNTKEFSTLLRNVEFETRKKKMYWGQAYVGLDHDFMVKANLLVPEGYENTLYNWLLNFQVVNDEWTKKYNESKVLDEGEIFIISDPDMFPQEYPNGLAFFAENSNCACLLGMKYFGEHKKGTLTLAWSIAARNGYTACHGGQKLFDDYGKVIGVFGLSGSGKSTITLSDHNGKMKTTVLHDDAFIISNKDGSSISLEPSYFDKTQDYPLTKEQSKYFLTIQNCGATVDKDGNVVPVTEDIRNDNGRTVKSIFATSKRVYKIGNPCNAIFWIMKDNTLPPVVKVKSPELASAMGATLSTMRTTAEHVKEEERNKLVIVPYANPFRLYPLEKDYEKFKDLFANMNVDCYIINTGFFLQTKVTPKVTLGLIEDIVDEKAKFVPFGPIEDFEYMPIEGFEPNFNDKQYLADIKARMLHRIDDMNDKAAKDPADKLPEEAICAIQKVADYIK